MGNVSDGRTVLVVDDQEDIRELLRLILQTKGCRVVEARNGREAVDVAPRLLPDLILMDLSMPVLDGYEATRQIRSRPETSGIPVVAVSAFCDAQNWREALAAGCVDCVGKPVDFGLINGVLKNYLHIN